MPWPLAPPVPEAAAERSVESDERGIDRRGRGAEHVDAAALSRCRRCPRPRRRPPGPR